MKGKKITAVVIEFEGQRHTVTRERLQEIAAFLRLGFTYFLSRYLPANYTVLERHYETPTDNHCH